MLLAQSFSIQIIGVVFFVDLFLKLRWSSSLLVHSLGVLASCIKFTIILNDKVRRACLSFYLEGLYLPYTVTCVLCALHCSCFRKNEFYVSAGNYITLPGSQCKV